MLETAEWRHWSFFKSELIRRVCEELAWGHTITCCYDNHFNMHQIQSTETEVTVTTTDIEQPSAESHPTSRVVVKQPLSTAAQKAIC